MRQMARTTRDMYDALRAEGFTDAQALTLIGQAFAASFGAQSPNADEG